LTLIRVRNLWFKYYEEGPWILRDINLVVYPGDLILVYGPNGSGKSTVAKLIAGLKVFYQGKVKGDIEVCGIDVLKEPERAVEVLGYVAEDPESQLLTPLVIDELILTPINLGIDLNTSIKIAKEIAEIMRIKHLLNKSTNELSAGEAQRVALSAALTIKPRAIVMDEPLAYLDFESANTFVKYVAKLASSGASIIVFENIFHQ